MGLVQIAQHADDLGRATAFYRDLDGVRLLLDAGAPSALHYLQVDDLEATVGRLRTAGVEVRSEPHVIFGHDDDTLGPAGTDEWMAFVVDSEGNLVGLVEQRPRA